MNPPNGGLPAGGWVPPAPGTMQPGQFVNHPGAAAALNAFGQPLLNQAFQAGGMVQGPMQGGMNLQDQQLAQAFAAGRAWAVQQAAQFDRQQTMHAMQGLSQLTGAGWGPQQQAAAWQASQHVSHLTAQLAMVAPDLADQLHGSRGSAAVMASHVAGGLRYMRDPATGTAYDPREAGNFSGFLFQNLYGGGGAGMHGIGAGRAGQMFDEMTRRGLMGSMTDAERTRLGGQDANGMRGHDVERVAGRLKEMSGAVAAIRDLFGANGRPNAPMEEIFNGLEALTQGGMHWMDGGRLEMNVRRIHAMSRNMAGGVERYSQLARHGAGLAEHAGLDRSFGVQTAQSAMAFGSVFGMAGTQGFGGLSRDEATVLDQQLRTAAAASPMANAMGALMSMHEQGLIKGGPAAQLVQAIQSRDPAAMAQLSNMTPQQLMQVMQQSGVGGAVASTFLNAKDANQEAVHKHGLGDLVRGMQGQGEIANFMRNQLQAGMMGVLGEAGISNEEQATILPAAAEAARQALMNMPPEMLANPTVRDGQGLTRNDRVQQAVAAAIGPQAVARLGPKIQEVVAAAIRQMEGAVGRHPTLKKFKNLSGVVAMNRGDIQAAAHAELGRADREAEVASLMAGLGQGTPISRLVDAVANAGPNANLGQIALQALGGVDKQHVVQALNPQLQRLQHSIGQYRHGLETLDGIKDPQQRAAAEAQLKMLKTDIQAQVGALQGLAEQMGLNAPQAMGLGQPQAAGAGARPGLAGAAGAGGLGGPLQIKGTLTLRQDGQAELEAGANGAGMVPVA
jgi:hypothetical protein